MIRAEHAKKMHGRGLREGKGRKLLADSGAGGGVMHRKGGKRYLETEGLDRQWMGGSRRAPRI